ncbi:MAG: hypothetical protein WDN01_14860 [Rhizomicrobium sp.]
MTRIKIALALAATLVVTACYPPTTSHPVGTTAGLKPDPVLTGTWKGTNSDGKPFYLHFLQQSDGTLSAVIVESGPKAEDWNVVTATTATLAGNHYMNARLLWTNGKPEEAPAGTVPVLYRLDAKGVLTFSLLDEGAVKAAITSGKIKGTVEKAELGDATITAGPKALDAYFAAPGTAKLFSNTLFAVHKVD